MSWPDDVQRMFLTTHDVFKENLIHRFITVLFRVVDFVLDLYTDNTVLLSCLRLPHCSLVGFLFISSFTKHMICSHTLFFPSFRLSTTPLSCAVVVIFSRTFSVGDYCCSFHWTVLSILCFNFEYPLCFLNLLISFRSVYRF